MNFQFYNSCYVYWLNGLFKMIDINFLRADPQKVKNDLKIKNYDLDIDHFTKIDSIRKTLQVAVEDLQSKKNNLRPSYGSKRWHKINRL